MFLVNLSASLARFRFGCLRSYYEPQKFFVYSWHKSLSYRCLEDIFHVLILLSKKKILQGFIKMGQWLRELAALPEDFSLCTWWFTTAYNSRSKRSASLFWPPQTPTLMCLSIWDTYTQWGKKSLKNRNKSCGFFFFFIFCTSQQQLSL